MCDLSTEFAGPAERHSRAAVTPSDKPHPLAVSNARKTVVGYCDRMAVRPADAIRFFISTYSPGNYRARLVRVINGDGVSGAGRFKTIPVPAPFDGFYPGREQRVFTGSYIRINTETAAPLNDLESFSAVALVSPFLGKSEPQFALSRWNSLRQSGWAIGIDERGEGAAWVGDAGEHSLKLRTSRRITPGRWTMIGASFNAKTGEFRAYDVLLDDANFPFDFSKPGDPLHYAYGNRRLLSDWRPLHQGELRIGAACGDLMPNGSPAPFGVFNGKIDGVRIVSRALGVVDMVALAGASSTEASTRRDIVACWDFSLGIGTDAIHDSGPAKLAGQAVNWPQRGMRGYHWKSSDDWKTQPEEFTAVCCRDDDLIDAGWESGFSYTVPDDLKSGIYAVHLQHGNTEHYIPFIVSPRRGSRTADTALVLPTGTYLAYNNQAKCFTQVERYPAYLYNVDDMTFLMDHPEFGRSIYDNHTDGTPVQMSSWLRPSLTLTLNSSLHLLTADTQAIDWLEHIQAPFDVVTEDLIHREGPSLIKPYSVLITGQHPEYNSAQTQNTLSEYMAEGGRILYLGGNGFVNTIAWHPELPIIEIRKPNLDWTSPIWLRGESTVMEFDGTRCKSTERWPARELGVSFQGDVYAIYYMTGSTYYRLLPDANSPRAKFIFEGVGNRKIIGDFGTHFRGAAGGEVDAFAPQLGAPAHALHLARSEGAAAPHWANRRTAGLYEELYNDPERHAYASIVFFETPSGGAVFSVGSLAWVGALSHNDFDNDVCRITTNVLRRFLDPAPFHMPH